MSSLSAAYVAVGRTWRYAQEKGSQRLHLLEMHGETHARKALCGRVTERWRLTCNLPLGHACRSCQRLISLHMIRLAERTAEPQPETRLRTRVRLEVADLKEATAVIVRNHYLHRGRTMAQVPYWIILDDKRAGVLLYAYPRMSAKFQGHGPMNLVELARMWLDREEIARVLA